MKSKIITVLLFLIASAFTSNTQAQVLITDDNNYVAHPSSALDIYSQTGGLLIPRVPLTGTTDNTTINNPETSLLVYNTSTVGDVTPGFYFWNGTIWVPISGGDADWNIVGTNMHSVPTGNVGIGTATPIAKLEVAAFAPANQDGIKVSTPGKNGILIATPALDGIIIETPGIDGIKVNTPADDGIEISTPGDDGVTINTAADDGIEINTPIDDGIKINTTGDDGIEINTPGDDGIKINTPTDDGIEIVQPTDMGVMVSIPGKDGVHVINAVRHGVYASSGTTNAVPQDVPLSGVVGLGYDNANDKRKGVSGISLHSDGVWGISYKAGTFGNSAIQTDIVAGVKGVTHPMNPGVDNFAVAGIAEAYGTGVLGIGAGEHGHGMIGISGPEYDNKTITGVWGVAREEQWAPYKTRYPLSNIISKDRVGVLGQSWKKTGVWGESIEGIGMVANSGKEMKYIGDIPSIQAGLFARGFTNDVYGAYIQSDSTSGVVAISHSLDYKKAGIRAEGMSHKNKAAALDIHDGAITVSGSKRPAGKVPVTLNWIPIGDGDDFDLIGHYAILTISNDLIHPVRSVITMTPQISFDTPFMIDILSISDGVVTIKIGSLGPLQPPATGFVHYHIINDNGN